MHGLLLDAFFAILCKLRKQLLSVKGSSECPPGDGLFPIRQRIAVQVSRDIHGVMVCGDGHIDPGNRHRAIDRVCMVHVVRVIATARRLSRAVVARVGCAARADAVVGVPVRLL